MLHEFRSNYYAEILKNHLDNVPQLNSVTIQYSGSGSADKTEIFGEILKLEHSRNRNTIYAEYNTPNGTTTVSLATFFRFSVTSWSGEQLLSSEDTLTLDFVKDRLARTSINHVDIETYELFPAVLSTVRAIYFVLRMASKDIVTRAFEPVSTPDIDTGNYGMMVYAVDFGRNTTDMESHFISVFRLRNQISMTVANGFSSSSFDRITGLISRYDQLTNGKDDYTSLELYNGLLPIDVFFTNLFFDTALISKLTPETPMDVRVWDIMPLSRMDIDDNRSVYARAAKHTYIDLSVAKELFGDLEQCPVTSRYYYPRTVSDNHANRFGMYQWGQTFGASRVSDGPNISYEGMLQITKEIIYSQCEDCGSRDHVTFAQFVHRVEEAYSDILGTNDDRPDIYDHLLRAARYVHDDDEPSYYCGTCDRGEDEDDYTDWDNDYREEGFSSRELERLSAVATEHNKDLYNPRGSLYYFTDDNATYTHSNKDVSDYFINSWDHQPNDLRFIEGDDMEKTKLYMGLEWEIDGGGTTHAKATAICSALANNRPYAYTMTDGSLENGIEIATMPATLDAHTNTFNWSLACDTATALGYRGHDTNTSGIHIHINRNFFSDDKKLQLYRGSLMALVMERNWDDFARFSRRRYNRLDQWAKKKDLLKKVKADTNTNEIGGHFNDEYGKEKYVALNMGHSNTFEFRIFRSTTKPETILATLQFVSNLAHWCKYNGLAKAQTATIDDIINYKKYPELTAYWEENKDREVRD